LIPTPNGKMKGRVPELLIISLQNALDLKMADVEINGLTELDIVATKAALSSSSTALRLARIHNLEDKLRRHGV
jgi:hypothetical protein